LEREQLLDALTKGKPLAREYEKLRGNLESAESPIFLSGTMLTIGFMIFWLVLYAKYTNGTFFDVWGHFVNNPGELAFLLFFSVVPVILIAIIPVINLLGTGFVFIIGKCFFLGKQKKYRKEVSVALEKFTQQTQLSKSHCNTTIINKFIEYLETYQADNLKECAMLYNKEEQDKKVLAEIEKLKEEMSAVGDEVYRLRDR